MREYFEQLSVNKFNYFDEMDKFLEKTQIINTYQRSR